MRRGGRGWVSGGGARAEEKDGGDQYVINTSREASSSPEGTSAERKKGKKGKRRNIELTLTPSSSSSSTWSVAVDPPQLPPLATSGLLSPTPLDGPPILSICSSVSQFAVSLFAEYLDNTLAAASVAPAGLSYGTYDAPSCALPPSVHPAASSSAATLDTPNPGATGGGRTHSPASVRVQPREVRQRRNQRMEPQMREKER